MTTPTTKEAMQAALDALEALLEWDKSRNFVMPYRVRDPIHAAMKQLRAIDARPVGWYEAEASCRGMPLHILLSPNGQMCHSGRFHWTIKQPDTTNPVWPLYASPMALLRSAMGEGGEALTQQEISQLDRILEGFADCGETEEGHDVMLDFARRGYLECERYAPTDKAHKALAAWRSSGVTASAPMPLMELGCPTDEELRRRNAGVALLDGSKEKNDVR